MMQLNHEQKYSSEFSDEVLFLLALENPNIFATLIDRYQNVFFRKAQSILRNKEDAYDAVQETFVRIYSAARKYKNMEGASFRAWAYKILINQCITIYRKRQKEHKYAVNMRDENIAHIPDTTEMEMHENKLTKEYVLSLVSRLPLFLGKIVKLHFIDNISQKEIALMEGVSHEVVRTRIHRAKKELKKMLITI